MYDAHPFKQRFPDVSRGKSILLGNASQRFTKRAMGPNLRNEEKCGRRCGGADRDEVDGRAAPATQRGKIGRSPCFSD